MRALAFFLLVAGCSQRTEVDVTVDLVALSAQQLEAIETLVLEVQGDLKPFSKVIAIGDQLVSREGQLVYLPGVTDGMIELRVDGRDAAGLSVAASSFAAVQVRPNQAVSLRLVMQPVVPSTLDMAMPLDLSLPPDMSALADMSVVDTNSTCSALGGAVRFCEGFEGNLSAWTVFPPPGGTIGLDGVQKVRGAKALHYTDPGIDMGGTRDFVITIKDYFDWKPMYVRFFIYYAADTSSVGASVLTVASGGGYVSLGVQATGKLRVGTGGLGATDKTSATALPTNRWACLELSAVPAADAGVGAVRFHLDGTELLDLQMDADMTNVYGGLSLGFAANFGTGVPAGDLWYDELIVDDKPIGCAK